MLDVLSPQVVDLTPYYGVLRVSGSDALSFLQGQLTCDVREIGPSTLQLGGLCTHQGRLRTLFKIFKKLDRTKNQEIFYLELPKQLLPPILTHLKKYALFSKVGIEEESNIQIFGCQERLDGATLSGLGHNTLDPFTLNPLKWGLPPIQDQDGSLNHITLLRAPGWLPRFQLIGPKSLMAKLWEKFSHHAKYSGFSEWCLWDIRQGIPEVWPETTEQFFPHHLNLPNLKGVSFTKGCYCGQEIVARMHYRGNIKRRMVWGVLSDGKKACNEEDIKGRNKEDANESRNNTSRNKESKEDRNKEGSEFFGAGTELLVEGDQGDTLKVITAVPFSEKVEVLVEIPNRLCPESMDSQEFKVRIGVASSFKDLIIQPFYVERKPAPDP